jgi:hypothetical protein
MRARGLKLEPNRLGFFEMVCILFIFLWSWDEVMLNLEERGLVD